MSQPPNQPYPGQPYPEQPTSGQPGYPGQPYPGQPTSGQPGYPGQPTSGQPGYPGQPYPGQPYPGQPTSGQPGHSGQSYPGQSYPGQPYPGQPNPDVPTSVPPQPGYPAYLQQPAYPQPDYAGYPQPGTPPGYPPAPKKSRALPIALVSVALVLVLCVGGGTAIYLAGRNTVEKLTDTASSAAPIPTTGDPTTAPTASPTPTVTITITEPKKLSGRPKVTDAAFADMAEQLKKTLALLPGATQAVGAVYGRPAKQDLVLVIAAKAYVANPKKELASAFTGANANDLKLTGITSVPPGPLGGVAKCAEGKAGGAPLSMCAWADEGSTGMLIWYFTSQRKAEAEFVKARAQIEKKSN